QARGARSPRAAVRQASAGPARAPAHRADHRDGAPDTAAGLLPGARGLSLLARLGKLDVRERLGAGRLRGRACGRGALALTICGTLPASMVPRRMPRMMLFKWLSAAAAGLAVSAAACAAEVHVMI